MRRGRGRRGDHASLCVQHSLFDSGGVDLGQVHDPTACTVMEIIQEPQIVPDTIYLTIP